MSPSDAAHRFADELQALYQAAGKPDLATLCRQGAKQIPPVRLSDSTISDWLNGNTVPAQPEKLRFLVEFLEGRAERSARHGAVWWEQLRSQAWRERQAGRQRRPAKPSGAVETTYLQQVRRLAPAELSGREEELAELAAFCTTADEPAYQWWKAPAWAGKTALMAWFALNPPPRVRMVSFFVTARLGGQADRGAFVEAVLGQLAELLGEELPAYLTPATREAHLLRLLERAAPLVLVVDGLDEDLGWTSGSDAHSIAALLPRIAGVRVLVAGRPDPPLPADVPEDHPLRDPGLVRVLSPSPQARSVQMDARRDLRRLFDGSALQQDLLGLVTAAGGGLSADDLAELTDRGPFEVQDELTSVAGRAFQSAGQEYLLAHEDLQQTAVGYLGPTRLARHRERLYEWADRYAAEGWPAATPTYLLGGYASMLRTAGEDARLLVLATTSERHERMLAVTGGDTAALVEIADAMERADLTAAARLAVFRDRLRHRNNRMPMTVIAVRTALGQTARAEALAGATPFRADRARAQRVVAQTAAQHGDFETAERIAASISDPRGQITALVEIAAVSDPARARRLLGQAEANMSLHGASGESWRDLATGIARLGDQRWFQTVTDRAESAAREIRHPGIRHHELESLARVRESAWPADPEDVARQLMEALALAEEHQDPAERALNLALTASRATDAGLPELADHAITQALDAARSVPDGHEPAAVLVTVVGFHPNPTADVLDQAEAAARAVDDPMDRSRLLRTVSTTAARSDLDRAWTVAESVEPDAQRAQTQRHIAITTAFQGDPAGAQRRAHLIEEPGERAGALAGIADALSRTGFSAEAGVVADEAETEARAAVSESHAESLVALADAMVVLGDTARAAILVADAEPRLEDLIPPFYQLPIMLAAAEAMAGCGELHRAERLARLPNLGPQITEAIAATLVRRGETDRAVAFVQSLDNPLMAISHLIGIADHLITLDRTTEAKALISTIETLTGRQAVPLSMAHAGIATLLARLGDIDLAEAECKKISDAKRLAQALATVASHSGDAERAGHLLDRAQRAAEQVTGPPSVIEVYCAMADAVGSTGFPERAAQWLREAETVASAEPLTMRDQLLAVVAVHLARAGEAERAELLVDATSEPNWNSHVQALGDLAAAFVATGEIGRAVRLALAISPNHHFHVRLRTVTALAEHGATADALRLARSIGNPDIRARALASVAANTDEPTARELLHEALRSGDWAFCVGVLAAKAPDAARTIADEFMD